MKIKKITYTNKMIPMCDISVDSSHCFFYNGIAVHNSNKQKAEALLRVGIDTGIVSEKSGQMKLDKDSLEVLAKKYKKEVDKYNDNPEYFDDLFEKEKKQKGGVKRVPYEVIAWLLERSTLRKQLSSYTEKLSKLDTAFINYKLFDTGTGRLASGGSGNEYFMNLNYQNLTKPKPAIYRAFHKSHPFYNHQLLEDCLDILDYKFREVQSNEYIIVKDKETGEIIYDKDNSGNFKLDKKGNKIPKMEIGLMLDESGNTVPDTMYLVESTKKELNIRSAITVPDKKDWLFVSMDFSSEEIYVAGNLSKEPNFIEPIKNGRDLHEETAKAMFGNDYDKSKRKLAKYCLGENSFIATNRGLVRPIDLIFSDKLLSRYGYFGDFGYITEENQDTIEILYSNGIVEEYKSDHEILIWNGKETKWKSVSDLTEDDQIVGTTKLPFDVITKDNIVNLSNYTAKDTKNNISINVNTKEFAYLMGQYLGDGTIDRRKNKKTGELEINSFRIHHAKQITSFIDSIIKKLGFISYSFKDYGELNDQLRIFSKSFATYIEQNFGCVENKHIPDWVFTEWDNELLSYLLAGLIDSDGKCKSNSVAFSNSNLDMINKIALICMQLGIKTSLTQSKAGITKDGVRSYKNKAGEDYKIAYSLNFYDMQDVVLPIQLEYKRPKETKKVLFGWKYEPELFEEQYSKVLAEVGTYSNSSVITTDNLRRGRCNNMTSQALSRVQKWFNFPLKEEYQPLKILKKTQKTGKIYAIEVLPHHEYISSGVISANCNFGLLYGGSHFTLMQTSKLSEDLCKEMYDKYWKTMVTLKNWMANSVSVAKLDQDGNVYTYFGRPRRLKFYLSSDNKSLRSFGERSVTSHKVQGSCGDVMRIVLVQLYKQIFSEPQNFKEIQFSGCVHDEINTVIRKDSVYKWYPVIKTIMEIKRPDWALQLKTSIEFGSSYGELYPFEMDSSGVFRPKRA